MTRRQSRRSFCRGFMFDNLAMHGLPGRPWFGRAVLDYTLTGGRAGRE